MEEKEKLPFQDVPKKDTASKSHWGWRRTLLAAEASTGAELGTLWREGGGGAPAAACDGL